MLVAFDVGNTNINIGVFDETGKPAKQWRIKTDINKTYDEFGVLVLQLFEYNNISIKDIEGIIVSSVVPDLMFNLEAGIRKYLGLEPIIVTSDLDLGITINYDKPAALGSDRICNAVAAYTIYGGPVIIVDIGTAGTICGVSSKGEFLGGAILPGPRSLIDAMYLKTSRLPKINLEKPSKVIGTNTIDGMQAGIIFGYAGAINEIVKRVKREMGEDNITVIGTGGLVQLIMDEVECINEIYDYLTLEGLRIIFERNR